MPFTHATRVQIPSGSLEHFSVAVSRASDPSRLGAQGMEMCHDASGENRNVVSALENAENPPLGMSFRYLDDLCGQGLEVFNLETQVADGVFDMGIEPRADQNKLGLDAIGQGV